MIIGKLEIGDTALHTHNDSYVLGGISAVSTRRPFLTTGFMIGGLCTVMGLGFYDILFPGELLALASIAVTSILVGAAIGQLRLVSRDLRGSPIADAVYGTYSELNRKRREIAAAVERANAGVAS